jgi:hypothetical protein
VIGHESLANATEARISQFERMRNRIPLDMNGDHPTIKLSSSAPFT